MTDNTASASYFWSSQQAERDHPDRVVRVVGIGLRDPFLVGS
jgi:hypothetical protein